jgi:RNA polymerase sigma factor (sigma-70 family)
MDPESSFELIERAQAGDDTALTRLLERYRPRLRRWASGRLPRYAREFSDTEDLVQDVLLGTFRNFQAFDNRDEWALQRYLRRAVMNRVRTELEGFANRPKAGIMPEGMASPELSPLQKALGAETFERYDAALARLSEPEQEAVIARLELGCSFQEVALLLDKTEDAARMTVVRAVKKVATAMSDGK